MEFLTSLITVIAVCAVVVTPAVILGNYVYDRWKSKKAD